MGEEVRSSIEWLIKVGAKGSYRARKWDVPVASASQLANYYRTKLGYGEDLMKSRVLSASEISHTQGFKRAYLRVSQHFLTVGLCFSK